MSSLKEIYNDMQGKKFFALTLLLFIMLSLYDSEKGMRAMLYSLRILSKVAGIIILIILLIFLTNAFVDRKRIRKWFEQGKGMKGWIIAIIGGIISSGPIYMWYPLLADLKERGLRYRYIACFLYNRAVKIPLLPLLIYYFGLPIAILLSIYMIIFSILNGLIVEKTTLLLEKRKTKE